jgi:aspartate racemase
MNGVDVTNRHRDAWGVLGGMGPLASAEFLKTIYESNPIEREQDSPVVVLCSDPTFPDRTELLLSNRRHVLVDQLNDSLARLCATGVDKIVICCTTIHSVLPEVSRVFRERVVSLVEVTLDALLEQEGRFLLLCTNGARQSGLFESHAGWKPVRDRIVLPDSTDQNAVHGLIYRIKRNVFVEEDLAFIAEMVAKYDVNGLIAGCTEMHILVKRCADMSVRWIDPLSILAREIGGQDPTGAESPLLRAHQCCS